MHRIESADVRRAVRRTGWLMVLNALASEVLTPALRRPGRHVPCPMHGDGGKHGRGDGFRLFPDVDRTGGGICATCGAYPDGLALLQWLFGWSFPETLWRVAGVIGLTDAPRKPLAPALARTRFSQVEPPNPERLRRALRQTWSASLPPCHPDAWPMQRYLAGRGLDASVLNPRVVRFHPTLEYWSRDQNDRSIRIDRFPAMLALVSDPDGRPLTLHRTYLRHDGLGKAPVPSPKKLMPQGQSTPLSGAAIRLFAGDASGATELSIAEGIETALAVHAMTGLPIWASLSATLLQGFRPPAGTQRLSIWTDKDRSGAGEHAASVLRQRLGDSLDIRILLPHDPIPTDARGIDWADVWLMRHSEATERAVA
jgi:phage/plasmid primase-like uncharacterized protein